MGMHGMHAGGFGGGGIVMFLLFLLLVGGLIFALKSGRFGRYRGPWGPGPWGPGQQPGGDAKQQQAGPPWAAWGQPAPQAPRPEDDALKVLADRLASGDIAPDEYLQRVSVLRQQGPAPHTPSPDAQNG